MSQRLSDRLLGETQRAMLTLQTPQLLESYIGHAHGLHPSKSTPMDALEVVGNTKELGLDLPKEQLFWGRKRPNFGAHSLEVPFLATFSPLPNRAARPLFPLEG